MVKITDVAAKAGVSVQTVSRVLNNRGYISQATREKVHQAIDELNYQPNELARSLHRGKSNLIGLIVPKISHPFFCELAYYLERYAYQKGYKLLLCNSNRDKSKESKYLEMLKKNRVDGIIMGSHVLDVEHYLNLNLPIISLDRILAENIPFVSSDNVKGGKIASQLLIHKHCRKLAYIYGGIGGPPHNALLASGRFQGFKQVIEDNRIEYTTLLLDETDSGMEFNLNKIIGFLKEYPEVDGVFASSDVIAAWVIQACHHLKKAIPEEIKVIGYDDVGLASLVSPRLTTISQPIQKMSELTIELLTKQIDGEEVPLKNYLPVTIIERDTT
ncbi:LacI family DNA-binding transcriptional regulator [Bacillus xiapuensis]|uniref:LacI family DNA-binding transcriptional regulator n=1 Tax=Bacillus xiapuensis TaxID=2014075 RepID=A0ABU6N7N2_9BACI|nr:LacI family DNA-binding transcriptional regulator [Bacillus xiapuensis]